jgi:GDP-D-mannose 3', 5'-epimerase
MQMNRSDLVVVTGAGGFIGGHLIRDLREQGFKRLRAVDIKPVGQWYQRFDDVENVQADMTLRERTFEVIKGARYVFNLAADMGGIGFIENNKTSCMLSVLSSTHVLVAANMYGAERLFYSSSACVYAAGKQRDPNITALNEEAAYPAEAEDGYGWEKLFSERMCRHFREDYGLQTRVGRYHNVYGPNGTYKGGREKAPAAICRKVIEAKLFDRHEIEIWGDGHQTRSFMYIDDCILGSKAVLESDILYPINLGSAELISINGLVDIVEDIAGIRLKRHYKLDAPQGVRGRNSDNTKIKEELGWEPSISLREGLQKTYAWIYDRMKLGLGLAA